MRGKNAGRPLGAKRAAWVSPRLRPCMGEALRTEYLRAIRRSNGPRAGSGWRRLPPVHRAPAATVSVADKSPVNDDRTHPDDDGDRDQVVRSAARGTPRASRCAAQDRTSGARAVAAIHMSPKGGRSIAGVDIAVMDELPRRCAARRRGSVAGRLRGEFAEQGHRWNHTDWPSRRPVGSAAWLCRRRLTPQDRTGRNPTIQAKKNAREARFQDPTRETGRVPRAGRQGAVGK